MAAILRRRARCGKSARLDLWEPRVSNHPGRPGPTPRDQVVDFRVPFEIETEFPLGAVKVELVGVPENIISLRTAPGNPKKRVDLGKGVNSAARTTAANHPYSKAGLVVMTFYNYDFDSEPSPARNPLRYIPLASFDVELQEIDFVQPRAVEQCANRHCLNREIAL